MLFLLLLSLSFSPQVSAGSLHAFESPNCSPLVSVGITIHLDNKSVWRPGTISALTVQSKLCRDVVLLRLFPSIRTETIKHFLEPPIRGVVLQCYGAGNMPSNREDIIQALTQAADNGAIIVSCTQVEIGRDYLYTCTHLYTKITSLYSL